MATKMIETEAKTKIEKSILNTTINKQALDDFREKCKVLNVPMNTILEIFMKQFSNGDFELKFGKKTSIELVEND